MSILDKFIIAVASLWGCIYNLSILYFIRLNDWRKKIDRKSLAIFILTLVCVGSFTYIGIEKGKTYTNKVIKDAQNEGYNLCYNDASKEILSSGMLTITLNYQNHSYETKMIINSTRLIQ